MQTAQRSVRCDTHLRVQSLWLWPPEAFCIALVPRWHVKKYSGRSRKCLLFLYFKYESAMVQLMAEKTLFEKIIAKDIPANFVHEDARCVAIRDIDPQAPTHILIIPRKVIARVGQATSEDQALLGHLLLVAGEIARKNDFKDAFRIVINNGPSAGETVPHLHVHLLSGRKFEWPPG